MLRYFIFFIALILMVGCKGQPSFDVTQKHFTVDIQEKPDNGARIRADKRFKLLCLNPYTPVKNQRKTGVCWVYAMLATIESNHIAQGDSVNLSTKFLLRHRLADLANRYFLCGGQGILNDYGTLAISLDALGKYGAMGYDAYSDDDLNSEKITERLKKICHESLENGDDLKTYNTAINEALDDMLGPVPRYVFMSGMEYTPLEFSHSVCAPGEYRLLTSFSHHPYNEDIALEIPDNWEQHKFYNVSLDTLVQKVVEAIKSGRSVCWEGDITEKGFSFDKGLATMGTEEERKRPTQQMRQGAFEHRETTDDHAMSIIGMAKGKKGRLYFICKNSWGTANPYGGLMLMSEDYLRMKTIAVAINRVGGKH